MFDYYQTQQGSFQPDRSCGQQSGPVSPAGFRFESLKSKVRCGLNRIVGGCLKRTGVGGLNLGELGDRNRNGRHAQIFFLGADVLIIQTQSNNSNIRKIKHLPAVAWARDGKIEDLFSVGPFGQFRVPGKMSRNSGWGVGG